MKNLWLWFLTIGVLTLIVFAFYFVSLQPIQRPKLENPILAGSVTEPTVTFLNPARGNPTPKVTIITYSDFECPACKQVNTSVEVVLRTYPDDVKQVWKDMPNEGAHPMATPAAIAAKCANTQGKFWEYHDLLFERQTFLAEDQFVQIAREVGLNETAFSACYESQDTLPAVKKDFEEGLGLGVVATPTLYINGTSFVGALTTDDLLAAVRDALLKAEQQP